MDLSSLVVLWGVKYEVESALEVVLGDDRSICSALATRGVRVMTCREGDRLPDVHADLVVVHGVGAPAESLRRAWPEVLVGLAKQASKLLIVAVPDPDREPGARLRRVLRSALGRENESNEWGATRALAPILWGLGRVREHERIAKGAHAFVVDVTPRTPQARRKLRLASSTG